MNRTLKLSSIALGTTLCLLLSACGSESIQGEGPAVQEKRDVSNFSKIVIDGDYGILGKLGKTTEVVVSSNANILPYIKSSVSSSTLTIKDDDSAKLFPSVGQNIWFTTQQFDSLKLTGSSQFQMANLKTESLDITLSGAHKIALQGKSKDVKIKINGSSTINAKDLKTDNADIEVNGSGVVALGVAKSLKVTINGDGKVVYYGKPKVEKKINGSGQVGSAFGGLDNS